MLELLEAVHFEKIKGRPHAFKTPDGNTLELRVEAVTLKPRSRMSETGRMPFSVTLTSAPTQFIEGLCTVEFPDIGRVEHIMVSRQAAMGRDPQKAYFQILFN